MKAIVRLILILLVLAGLGAVGWKVYQKIQAKGDAPQRRGGGAVAVEVTPIRVASVRDVGTFTGSLQARTQFTIAPKIPGRLEKLSVNIGDRVTQGQLVAQLDDDEYIQQEEQAQAEVLVSRANLAESESAFDVAKREFERAKSLRAQKIMSEAEFDVAEANYKAAEAREKVAKATVAQREAALKAAQVRLSYTKIHAVWPKSEDGQRFVGERFVDEGAMLRANDGIVSILDISHLTAVIYVIERDYPKIKIGQKVTLTTDAFPGKEFGGTVERIAPELKETSRQARVEIDVPNADAALRPGMFVRVRIEYGEHAKTTVVPSAAIVRRDGREGIFLADMAARKARFVAVQTGYQERGLVEILTPPVEGEVVTLGQHLLEDGAAIVLPDEKPAGPPPASKGGSARTKAAGGRP